VNGKSRVASYIFSGRRGEDGDDRAGPPPPIAAHPAFPAIVATWFAVLLGLGTLVIPAVLLERLVEASGIAALVPAAAPPLGVTARAICAGAAAAAGVLLGLALARRVAASHGAVPGIPAERAPRPLAIADEFGESGLENEDSFMAAPTFEPEEKEAGMREEPFMEAENVMPLAAPGDPLETLGLEQLVERLGQAIESRRARLRVARPSGFDALEAAPPEDVARAAAAYFARPADFQTTRAAADDPSEPSQDEAADGVDVGYGSLLSLGNPLAYRDDGDIPADEEAPAREAPVAELSASTDAALRAALARLQRLSGAA
jgi:hypothetical protein